MPKEIKVLHIISQLGLGGAERQLLELLDSNRSHAICQLAPTNYFNDELKNKGINIFDLGMKRNFPDIRGIYRLNKIINTFKPHIIHGWMYHAILIEAILRKLGKNADIPLVWGLRCSNMDTSKYSIQLKFVINGCKFFSSFPDVIINNSEVGKTFHQKIGFKNKNIVISNGIDTKKFSPSNMHRMAFRKRWNISISARVLLHVGRVDPMKDHETLISAFEEARKLHPKLVLLLAGSGTQRYSNVDGIVALGAYKEIMEVYSSADIIVSSSAFGEGFSNALGEGMSSCLIPISTDVGDAKTIINSDQIGKLIPVQGVKELTSAILEILALEKQSFVKKQEEARNWISNNYSKQKMQKNYKTIYEDLLIQER